MESGYFMRYVSLDMERGLAILAMLFINIVTVLSTDLPHILKHNEPTMLPADLIAPLFQFVLGISLVISVTRRKERGEKDVWKHVLKRAGLLIILGFILRASLYDFHVLEWGVLQSLGVGLVMGYLFLSLSVLKRAIAAFSILLGYSLLCLYLPGFYDSVYDGVHGGLIGAISYGTVTIFGTVAGELFYERKEKTKKAVVAGLDLMLLSLVISSMVPFNRLTVSASYMLFSAGFFFMLTALFYVFGERMKREIKVLSLFGRNSLSLWIAQYLLIYIPLIYLAGGCCFFPFYMGFAATILILPVFYIIADILEWKGIRVPI